MGQGFLDRSVSERRLCIDGHGVAGSRTTNGDRGIIGSYETTFTHRSFTVRLFTLCNAIAIIQGTDPRHSIVTITGCPCLTGGIAVAAVRSECTGQQLITGVVFAVGQTSVVSGVQAQSQRNMRSKMRFKPI